MTKVLKFEIVFPVTAADALAVALSDLECLGWQEADGESPGSARWIAYFPENTGAGDVDRQLRKAVTAAGFGSERLAIRTQIVPPFDWAARMREEFLSDRITDRLVVSPSWDPEDEPEGGVVIRLDPGQAFGTGRHESTRLCLIALERYFDRVAGADRVRFLDIGCGSGILSAYAARRGARSILAIDIDPLAVENAKTNLAANGASGADVRLAGPRDVDGAFDVVAANLREMTLAEFADAICPLVAPGGIALLSGLLTEERASVETVYAAHGLAAAACDVMAGWICLTVERPR